MYTFGVAYLSFPELDTLDISLLRCFCVSFNYCLLISVSSCFISHIGVFFGTFLGPVLALVLFNTVVFVLVIRVLIKHSVRKLKNANTTKKLKGTFKALISIMSIMSMFGLQWLFGALTIAEASLVFQWLFVIFSTLQGFFLFLFFVVLGKETRDEWLNLISFGRRKRERSRSTSTQQKHQHSKSNTSATEKTRLRLLSASSIAPDTDTQQLVSPTGESSVEMSILTRALESEEKAAEPPLHTTNTAHETETELIIVNENALTDRAADSQSEYEKEDLSEHDAVKLLEEGRSAVVDSQLPPHILHGRCMHPRVSQFNMGNSEERKETIELTRRETVKETRQTIPDVMDSQVPPHIAERRLIRNRKPATAAKPARVPKQSTPAMVDSDVPQHVLEHRFMRSYTSAPSFMTPK